MLGCAGAGPSYAASSYPVQESYGYGEERSAGGYATESVAADSAGDVVLASVTSSEARIDSRARVAQASLTQAGRVHASVPATVAPTVPSAADVSDARDTSGPLLVYTATLHMAVFEVRATQDALAARARSMGGVLTQRSDDRLVLRVPAERFEAFLDGIEAHGDVLHRDVVAADVGEEFRDLSMRIQNFDVVRQQLERLLAQATDVTQALAVQRELERVTGELEVLRGRQRYLADRIAFSTITFAFRPLPREALGQAETFRLPIAWLEALGLASLLEVR